MLDLHSPFEDDEHSTPVRPCKDLEKEEGDLTKTDDVEQDGSVSPFQMISSQESIGPAPGSGTGSIFSSGTGTPFSIFNSTDLSGTGLGHLRPPSPPGPRRLLTSDLAQLFGPPQVINQAPARAQTQFPVRLPAPPFAPPTAATTGPVRRAISGGRRFAAPPSVSNIKTTAPVTSSDTLSDGRIDREEGAKRRFIRDGPPELPSRIVPMPSQDDESDSGSDEDSEEDWSDDGEDAAPLTKPGVPLDRPATGEKMVWFAQPKNQSPSSSPLESSSSSRQHSPVVARDVPFTAHLGMFNSSPTNGTRPSFPAVSPPANNGPAKTAYSFNAFVPSTQAAPPAANSPTRSFPIFTPTAQLHSSFPAFAPQSAQTSSSNSITSVPPTSSFTAFQPPHFSGQPVSNGNKIWTDFAAFAPPSSTSSSFSPPTSFNTASSTSSFPSMSGSVFAPPAPPARGPEAYDDDFETDSDEEEEELEGDEAQYDDDHEGEYNEEDSDGAEYDEDAGRQDVSSSQALSVRNWTEEDAEDGDEDEEDQTVKIAGSTEPGLEEEVQVRFYF